MLADKTPVFSKCSPHTRGDGPGNKLVELGRLVVLPTRVGMARLDGFDRKGYLGSPHTRGDGPNGQDLPPAARAVLPTRVGMARRMMGHQ